jgi:formylglycine-generating enzyme required for sulfatase activity
VSKDTNPMLTVHIAPLLAVSAIALTALGCRDEPARGGSPEVPATTASAKAALAESASGAPTLVPQRTDPVGRARDTVAIPANDLRVTKISFPETPLPEQIVHIPAFEIDRYEVRVHEYQACVDAGVCSVPQMRAPNCNFGDPRRGRHPINCVSQSQAVQFCAWVSARLPSEDEWDAAAIWAESKERWPGDPRCMERTETCGVDETASSVLPGWSDNVAEWTTSPFCHAKHSLCSETIVKGRAFHDTAASQTRERRLPPSPGNTNVARRRGDEVGFRCARLALR